MRKNQDSVRLQATGLITFLTACRRFLAVAVVFFSIGAHAQHDPYARRVFFGKDAKYAGAEIDVSRMRNLQELSDGYVVAYGFAKSAAQIDHNYIYVANFRHRGRFWVAKIPKHGVERAIFQFQNLSSLAKKGIPVPILDWIRFGHVQMRFQMKPESPVELRTQQIGVPHETAQVTDFSYALIALHTIAEAKDPFKAVTEGLDSGYGIAHNFVSTEDSAAGFKRAKLNVEQYPLNVTPAQADVMLQTYVGISTSNVENEIYDTLENSCVTFTMRGLYTAVSNKHVMWWGRFWRNWRWLRSTDATFENNTRAVVPLLEKQGYITPSKRMPNIEVEFQNFSAAKSCEDLFKA